MDNLFSGKKNRFEMEMPISGCKGYAVARSVSQIWRFGDSSDEKHRHNGQL
jgi:hypothetical protein